MARTGSAGLGFEPQSLWLCVRCREQRWLRRGLPTFQSSRIGGVGPTLQTGKVETPKSVHQGHLGGWCPLALGVTLGPVLLSLPLACTLAGGVRVGLGGVVSTCLLPGGLGQEQVMKDGGGGPVPAGTWGPSVSAALRVGRCARTGPPQLGEACCAHGSPSLTLCLALLLWALGAFSGSWGTPQGASRVQALVFLFIHCESGLGGPLCWQA